MRHTERKYWSSGYSVRGKDFWALAFRVRNIGVMVCKNWPFIEFYKLD